MLKNINRGELSSLKNKKPFKLPLCNRRVEEIFKADLFLRGVALDTALPSAQQHLLWPAPPASEGDESANEGLVAASPRNIFQQFASECHFQPYKASHSSLSSAEPAKPKWGSWLLRWRK